MSSRLKEIALVRREYKRSIWATIWEDALGVHYVPRCWNITIVGDLKWLRQKGWR